MRTLLMGCLMALLLGCAGPQVSDYANEQPRLELSDYFKGDMQAWGMFQNRSGEVVKRFHVAMTGTWEGDVGVLTSALPTAMAAPSGASGPLKNRLTAAGVARQTMWLARLSVRWPATPCTGVTNCG